MIYLITYQLKSNRSYQAFYDAIKSYSTWWHYLDKIWLIKTSDNPKEICKKLRPCMDNSDSIFVVEVNLQSGHYYGFLNKNAWDWIKRNR